MLPADLEVCLSYILQLTLLALFLFATNDETVTMNMFKKKDTKLCLVRKACTKRPVRLGLLFLTMNLASFVQ